jgi:hypothetical protein
MPMVGGEAMAAWQVQGTAAQVVSRLRAAARRAGLALEVGPDQAQEGALCGWAFAGNGTGNPIGRMDVAEVRLSPAPGGGTAIDLRRVDGHVPSRFEKQLQHSEMKFRRPLIWSTFLVAARRLTSAAA